MRLSFVLAAAAAVSLVESMERSSKDKHTPLQKKHQTFYVDKPIYKTTAHAKLPNLSNNPSDPSTQEQSQGEGNYDKNIERNPNHDQSLFPEVMRRLTEPKPDEGLITRLMAWVMCRDTTVEEERLNGYNSNNNNNNELTEDGERMRHKEYHFQASSELKSGSETEETVNVGQRKPYLQIALRASAILVPLAAAVCGLAWLCVFLAKRKQTPQEDVEAAAEPGDDSGKKADAANASSSGGTTYEAAKA